MSSPSPSPGPAAPLERAAVLAALVVGLALRWVDLDTNPPGFWQDEASTAVDAMSLWRTGRDRSGQAWPVISPSFGDWPLAGYRYLAAPVLGLFGPSVAAERSVAAAAGSLLLIVTWIWTRRRFGPWAGLGALVSGALGPTWVHFSRFGSEAITLPASLMLGALALDLSLSAARASARRVFGLLSILSLGFAGYTYHSTKLVLPLFVAGLLALEAPRWRARVPLPERWVGLAALALLLAPSAWAALSPEGMARVQTVALWVHEPPSAWLGSFASNYAGYWDPLFLFLEGSGVAALSPPGVGLYGFLDLALLPACAALFVARRAPRAAFFVLGWALLGPIPGALTHETRNPGRVIGWLPALHVLSGLGLATWAGWVRPRWLGVSGTVLAGWVTWRTWIVLMVAYPRWSEEAWQFELLATVRCARAVAGERRVVISPELRLGELYARFVFEDQPDRWAVEPRTEVGADEVFATPVDAGPPPAGDRLCEIRARGGTGRVRALVLGRALAP